MIAAGRRHSVGRGSDGTVVAVGNGAAGELLVDDWTEVVGVAAGNVHSARNTGRSHTVGLRGDGTVLATGWNADGQCEVGAWREVVGIAAGWRRTLGVLADGRVVAVGRGAEGACEVSDWREIVQVSCGDWHSVGLRADARRSRRVAISGVSAGSVSGESWSGWPPAICTPSAYAGTAPWSRPMPEPGMWPGGAMSWRWPRAAITPSG